MNIKNSFYLTNEKEFKDFKLLAQNADLIALDTEFSRQNTYYPILSLIQIAIKDSFYIIDCLRDFDITDFLLVLANKNTTKIIHSPLQDLQILNHLCPVDNKINAGFYDTQIMANFAGFGFNISYSNLVTKILNKELDKKQQVSDWQKRPLNIKQIEYAFLDVAYLEEVYFFLYQELEKRCRLGWFKEEMENYLNRVLKVNDEDLFKHFSLGRHHPKNSHKLKKLILWRETKARELNIPRQHLIKNETLEKIVIEGNCKDLKISSDLQEEIYQLLQLDEELGISNFNSYTGFYLNDQQKIIFNHIKSKVADIAKQEDLSEQFLMTTNSIKKLILGKQTPEKLISGWRYDLMGKEILNYLN